MTIAIPNFLGNQVDVPSNTLTSGEELPKHHIVDANGNPYASYTSSATEEILQVISVDNNKRSSEIDKFMGYQVCIELEQHKRNEGELFRYAMEVNLTTGSVHDMLISAGAGPNIVMLDVHASADEKFKISLFEAPTYSAAGTVVTPWNDNPNSSNVPAITTLYDTPTLTADGTFRDGAYADKYSLVQGDGYLPLKSSTAYLLRIEYDKAAANGIMAIKFFEQSPVFSV